MGFWSELAEILLDLNANPATPKFATACFNSFSCQILSHLVPTARLELAQLSPLPPQDSVSTNFTTSALLEPATPNRPELRKTYFGTSLAFESETGGTAGFAASAGFLSAAAGAGCDFTVSCMTLPVVFGLCEPI